MDCSTAGFPANVHDSPGKESSSSDELIPLSQLLMRPQSEEKKSCGNTQGVASKEDKASDVSSEDEPLLKLKTARPKKQEKKENTPPEPNCKNKKNAGLSTDESSDNEPLAKISKVPSKAAKKTFSVPAKKKSVERKKRASPDKDDSSDDEPLSEIAKRVQSRPKRKASVVPSKKSTPVITSKRSAARKKVKYVETSSESSDDESLVTIKRKGTDAPKEKETSAHKKNTTKHTDKFLEDSSLDDEDDDDVPLVNLVAKKRKPVKKNTKRKASQGSASKKKSEFSDESSDDEPLINVVKKKRTNVRTKTKTKASTPKKRNVTPKRPRKKPVTDSLSNSSDDEPLIKAAKHPSVTKILRIHLERCDDEQVAGSLKKNRTDETLTAETPVKEDSDESPEEEEEEE